MLPEQLRNLEIEPRHKVMLVSRRIDREMWTVLLTEMPGQSPRAWKMSAGDYFAILPKHGTRERWIRENLPPTYETEANEQKRRPLMLLLF